MIDRIGNSVQARVEQARVQGAAKGAAPAAVEAARAGDAQAVASPAKALAAAGAPVDTDKVARIRAEIAGGSYTVDANAVADKMISLDLDAGRS